MSAFVELGFNIERTTSMENETMLISVNVVVLKVRDLFCGDRFFGRTPK